MQSVAPENHLNLHYITNGISFLKTKSVINLLNQTDTVWWKQEQNTSGREFSYHYSFFTSNSKVK